MVRLRVLFWSFLKIGLFTFGGGYAMIPLIQREMIEKRGWIAKSDFLELLAIAQSAPGPIALNMAVFIGYRSRGYVGALMALLGVALPSFCILLIFSMFFSDTIRENEIVNAAFKGMSPVVVALIVVPVISMAQQIKPATIIISLITMFVMWYWSVSPMYFIGGAIVAGVAWAYFTKNRLEDKC